VVKVADGKVTIELKASKGSDRILIALEQAVAKIKAERGPRSQGDASDAA
jgi:hypothetical protein